LPSFLNGLSQLGAGVASFAGNAGLELQKAQLANQQAILADQLATARETTLQGQQQQFQAGLQQSSQAFQGSQTDKTLAAEQARQSAELAARSSEGAANRAAQLELEGRRENAPTETEKLFRFLGINPNGTPASGGTSLASPTSATSTSGDSSAQRLPGPRTTGGVAADGSVVPPSSGAATGSIAPSPSANPIAANLVNKVLGIPESGSQAATRYAIAQDVNADPAFKYKTAGQKAAEVELRFAVAEGKMTDPASREKMAQGIASYQISPLSSFALTKPGAPETMARAIEINPDYQESRYPEVSKAMGAFGSGPQGNTIRSLNVGVQHLNLFDEAAAALGNGDMRAINSLKNTFQAQFGVAPPTTFDGLKQIVGTEIEKAVAGGIGSAADRERLMESLNRASSPAQLQAMTDGFRGLMLGQLIGLKNQYEDATGFKSGPFAFENKLAAETKTALQQPHARTALTDQSAVTPSYDEFGNVSVKPSATPAIKPPAIGDVQQGYSFTGGNPADPKSWKPVQ
jgi:hypothetical protein